MPNLDNISSDELLKELERRKKIKTEISFVEKPDLSSIKSMLSEYVNKSLSNEYISDDFNHYLFETVLTTFYGKDIFKKIK